MPPCLDIYALAPARDRPTLERFLDRYVDRALSDARGSDWLALYPLGVDPDTFAGEREEVRAPTLRRIVDHAVASPRRCFVSYLMTSARRPDLYRAILAPTADDRLVLGLSVDDPYNDDAALALACRVLHELCEGFGCPTGFVGCETPPPLTEAAFHAEARRAMATFPPARGPADTRGA